MQPALAPQSRALLALLAAAGLAAGLTAAAHAQTFSVAPGGPSLLSPNIIYDTQATGPIAVGGGAAMRCFQPNDDIDAVSRNLSDHLDLHFEWIWWFSVDAGSTGLPPEVLPPYNVNNQASARQQAADIFLSTEGFSATTGILPVPPSLGINNNALCINQSQLYPRSSGLRPIASPFTTVPGGVQQDEVDATARGPVPLPGESYFYSLTANSPSLPLIVPGVLPSGANIFVDTDIAAAGGESLYAQSFALGLVPQDDILALVIFDENDNLLYDTPDAVYFTLAPGSPTLALFGNSSSNILVSRFGIVSLAVQGAVLGLLPTDRIDGLDAVPILENDVLLTIEAELGGPVPQPCPPDLSTAAIPGSPGYGQPNGVLNNEDFFYYLTQFALGNTEVADLTNTAVPGSPGYGIPNGLITNDDFFYYLSIFSAGC